MYGRGGAIYSWDFKMAYEGKFSYGEGERTEKEGGEGNLFEALLMHVLTMESC